MPPMSHPKNFGRGRITDKPREGRADAGITKVHVIEGKCRVCENEPVEAAHLWPRSLGAVGYGNADLIVALCKGCHKALDSHAGLELLPYLTVDEQCALVRAAGGIERARDRVTA